MRVEFAQTILEVATQDASVLFLTGDLGFMALEEVRDRLGERFINAGVAEQNMVSAAAGLAARDFKPIVYSIAPFATLRPYEQLRNDVCLHNLPVKVVGNGGGYGYGIMGSTHHALEDVGVMRTLPNMRVFVPAFGSDVAKCVRAMMAYSGPAYLRLGKSVPNFGLVTDASPWAPMRRVSQGSSLVVAAMGPVVEHVISLLPELPPGSVDLWSVGELSLSSLDGEFLRSAQEAGRVITVEEHYLAGGMAENMAPHLINACSSRLRFKNLFARGYPSGLYGSQRWHQDENALAGPGLLAALREMLGL